MKKFRCTICGFIYDGDEAPDRCPKCGALKEKFVELDEKAAELVERSRKTNLFHSKVTALAGEIATTCKLGIEDNLDPACVKVFKQSLQMAYHQMKLSMTEQQGHMNKGKWG